MLVLGVLLGLGLKELLKCGSRFRREHHDHSHDHVQEDKRVDQDERHEIKRSQPLPTVLKTDVSRVKVRVPLKTRPSPQS